jgi:hypothetical protein
MRVKPALTIFGKSGSLRRGSHNTSLLRAAALLPPPGVRLDLFEGLDDLLGYNEDSAYDRVCPRLRACERRSPRPMAYSSPPVSTTAQSQAS